MELQKSAASKAFWGLVVYYTSTIFAVVGGIIWLLVGGIDMFREIYESVEYSGGDVDPSYVVSLIKGVLWVVIIYSLVAVGQLVGYILYYIGLRNIGIGMDTAGYQGARNMATGALLMLISSVMGVFGPFLLPLSFISLLSSLVGTIFILVGAASFRCSQSLNEVGKRGAKDVYTAALLSVISIGAIFIPILGWIAIPFLLLISMVMNLNGWSMIRKSLTIEE